MPQGVADLLKGFGVATPPSRSSQPSRNESNDLFQKMLDGSFRKPQSQPQPADEQQPVNETRQSNKPKRADGASRKRKPRAHEDDQKVDDQDDDQTDASTATGESDKPQATQTVADEEAATDTVEITDKKESSIPADATTDPLAQAVAAAQQQAAGAKDAKPTKDGSDACTTAEDDGEVVLDAKKPLLARTTDQSDHATEQAGDANTAANPLNKTVAADAKSDDQPSSDDESAAEKIAAALKLSGKKPHKVAALGQTAPPKAHQSAQQENSEKQDNGASNVLSAMSAASAMAQLSDPSAVTSDSSDSTSEISPVDDVTKSDPSITPTFQPNAPKTNGAGDVKQASAPPPRPEAEFADANHDKLITSMKSQLMPNGGTMHMRLDPPELGVLQVTVRMQDGAMTASFETSNSDATKLLSHSLGQLKAALESQGVSVEKLHVQESPKNQEQQASSEDGRQQQPHEHDESAKQEQQRKEMLRRMWRRLGIGSDPLDMVA